LFKYYPKRRSKAINRLLMTGAVRFLIGEQETTSNWILKRFREKGILNKNNKITVKGRKIQIVFLEFKKEVGENSKDKI